MSVIITANVKSSSRWNALLCFHLLVKTLIMEVFCDSPHNFFLWALITPLMYFYYSPCSHTHKFVEFLEDEKPYLTFLSPILSTRYGSLLMNVKLMTLRSYANGIRVSLLQDWTPSPMVSPSLSLSKLLPRSSWWCLPGLSMSRITKILFSASW